MDTPNKQQTKVGLSLSLVSLTPDPLTPTYNHTPMQGMYNKTIFHKTALNNLFSQERSVISRDARLVQHCFSTLCVTIAGLYHNSHASTRTVSLLDVTRDCNDSNQQQQQQQQEDHHSQCRSSIIPSLCICYIW